MNRDLSTNEAGRILSVSHKTVSKLCDSGKLTFYRTSPRGDRRIRRDDLKAFCEARHIPWRGLIDVNL